MKKQREFEKKIRDDMLYGKFCQRHAQKAGNADITPDEFKE